MFGTMFSRNPFVYFENEFEDFNPWTKHYRPRSADQSVKRNVRRRQPCLTPFWEVDHQNVEEMRTEEPTKKTHHAGQHIGGCKFRQKNGCPRSDPRYDAASLPSASKDVPMKNTKTSKENESSGYEMTQNVQGTKDDSPLDLPSNEELQEREEEEKNTSPAAETIIQIEKENHDQDNLEGCDMNTNNTTNSEETPEPGKTADDSNDYEHEEKETNEDENTEEQMKSEDENTEEQMKSEGENIEKKLKLIELQLTKARELAAKEVLLSPRTDKQKLYLTEMLLRCILDLDTIETQGHDTVKQARRDAVRQIQSYLDVIENDTASAS
jgi:hypothetical protein